LLGVGGELVIVFVWPDESCGVDSMARAAGMQICIPSSGAGETRAYTSHLQYWMATLD
jgi:hypothetical protein